MRSERDKRDYCTDCMVRHDKLTAKFLFATDKGTIIEHEGKKLLVKETNLQCEFVEVFKPFHDIIKDLKEGKKNVSIRRLKELRCYCFERSTKRKYKVSFLDLCDLSITKVFRGGDFYDEFSIIKTKEEQNDIFVLFRESNLCSSIIYEGSSKIEAVNHLARCLLSRVEGSFGKEFVLCKYERELGHEVTKRLGDYFASKIPKRSMRLPPLLPYRDWLK